MSILTDYMLRIIYQWQKSVDIINKVSSLSKYYYNTSEYIFSAFSSKLPTFINQNKH